VITAGQERVDLSNYVRAILIYAGSKGMIAHAGGVISKLVNGTAIYPNLKKAEKLKPKDPGVLFGLGSFYLLAPVMAGGNLSRALDYLERCLDADPGFADAFVRLAQLYKAKGDLNKYALYMDKAFALDPENELALDIQSGKCDFICNVGKK
jgi:tetratricopeptide (TPR) repeat protein